MSRKNERSSSTSNEWKEMFIKFDAVIHNILILRCLEIDSNGLCCVCVDVNVNKYDFTHAESIQIYSVDYMMFTSVIVSNLSCGDTITKIR